MYCYNCGNKLTGKVNFCPKCGAKQKNMDDTYEKVKDYVISTGKTGVAFISKELNIAKDKVKEVIERLEKEDVVTPLKGNKRTVKEAKIVKKEKLSDEQAIMSILSYLSVLVLIPYFFNKNDDEYIKFHAREGMNLLFFWIIYSVCSTLLNLIKVGKRIDLLDGMVGIKKVTPIWISTPLFIIAIILFIINVIGIINAISNEKKELPIISKFRII